MNFERYIAKMEENYLQFHQNLMVLILLKKGQR